MFDLDGTLLLSDRSLASAPFDPAALDYFIDYSRNQRDFPRSGEVSA